MMHKKYDFIGIGIPYLDLIAPIDFAAAKANGMEPARGADVSYEICEALAKDSRTAVPGGTIINLMTGLAAFGHVCGCIGTSGNDDAGIIIRQNMQAHGIDYLYRPTRNSLRSSVVYCFRLPDGETTYVPFKNDAYELAAETMPSNLGDIADMYGIVAIVASHSNAYKHLVPSLTKARLRGAHIVMFLQAFTDKHPMADVTRAFVKRCASIIIGNEDEFNEFYKNLSEPIDDNTVQVKTMGSRGVEIRFQGEDTVFPPCEVISDVTDTIGAGDQFAAGFLSATLDDNPEDAVHRGFAAACEILRTQGGQPAIGTDWKRLKRN